VELRGFGIFTLKTRSARPGCNPKTGALISVPETQHPSFRTGIEMHARLNGREVLHAPHSTSRVRGSNLLGAASPQLSEDDETG
jgi:hypothetical protein